MTNFFDFKVKDSKKQDMNLDRYKGQVVLAVNVASKCGYTPQYKGLEEIYQKYHSKGFSIMGFPCNQFGAQEPGTEQEIQAFCSTTYDVTFPVLAKIDVNGPAADPIYQFMKNSEAGGKEDIRWNFSKFLIGKNGQVLKRYESKVEPKDIASDIEKALKA